MAANDNDIYYINNYINNYNYINYNYNNYIIDNRYLNESNQIISSYIINYIYRDILEPPQINFRLPIHFPRFVEEEIEITKDKECGISFEIPDSQTSCGHYFCRDAITTWLKQQLNENRKMTCPTCRQIITKVSVGKNR